MLEYIPEPEKALAEIRRVTKPGGYLFLFPAWNCTPWAADGYSVRPYSDFGWKDKLIKASVPLQESWPFVTSYLAPRRLVQGVTAAWSGDPHNPEVLQAGTQFRAVLGERRRCGGVARLV